MPKSPKMAPGGAKKPAVTATAFTNTDGQAAFDHFLPLAEERVAAGRLPRPARDVSVVRVNVVRGVEAVLARRAAIAAKVPTADFAAIEELPALAAALDFAASRVPVEMSDGEIAALLAEVRPLRKVTLAQLDIFATLGLVPPERVAAIRAGSGPLDSARDAVAIAGLFTEFAGALAKKHPFTADQLATLADLGNRLVRAMAPEAAKGGPAALAREASIRDALYGEILERYEGARELGVIAYGLRGLDGAVPPAHARTSAPRREGKGSAPA